MKHQVITLVGCGPRGITLLDRLLANIEQVEEKSAVLLNIVSAGDLGCGVHERAQPESLLVNTIACQITLFSDETVIGAGPVTQGMCFYTWAQAVGYKYDEENHRYNKTKGREIDPNDYLPRAIFGEYLHWAAKDIIEKLSQHITIQIFDAPVTELKKINHNLFELHLDNGLKWRSDYVLLATGHSCNTLDMHEQEVYQQINRFKLKNQQLEFIASPYPIIKATKNIESSSTVAIEGFGLTATDILSELTIGRAGNFVEVDNHRYRYVKSGLEPKIILYSSNGLPFCGRALNQKGVSMQYKPTFFTYEFIIKTKEKYGINAQKQLDFERHLLPMLIIEMQYCYYTTMLKNRNLSVEFISDFTAQYKKLVFLSQDINSLVKEYFKEEEKFDWQLIMDPTLGRKFDNVSYKEWIIGYLNRDLNQALEGNVNNPFKAACDVLRDIRDVLRFAIDFSGLTESSHRNFIKKYVPVMNRISVGPPKERIAELLALVEAGVVDIFFGKSPAILFNEEQAQFMLTSGENIKDKRSCFFDHYLQARINGTIPERDKSLLVQNGLASGLFRPFYNGTFHPGGLDINKDYNIINKNNDVETNVWALGTLVEGPKYYTYIVPRKGVNSTGIVDAGKIILNLLEAMNAQKNQVQRNAFFRPIIDVKLAVFTIVIFVTYALFLGMRINVTMNNKTMTKPNLF